MDLFTRPLVLVQILPCSTSIYNPVHMHLKQHLIAVKHLVSPVMLPVEIRLQYMTKSEERDEELCRKMWDLSENQIWHVLNASQTPLRMH